MWSVIMGNSWKGRYLWRTALVLRRTMNVTMGTSGIRVALARRISSRALSHQHTVPMDNTTQSAKGIERCLTISVRAALTTTHWCSLVQGLSLYLCGH
jgi:hypothetical protein